MVAGLFLKIAAAFWAAGTASVSNCGTDTSLFQINSLELTPATASPGQDMVLHLEYTVPQGVVIDDGTVQYDFSINGLPLNPPTIEPLCQDVPCPLGPGPYVNDTTSTWPTGVSGKLQTKMQWFDLKNTQLLCVIITGRY